jgi:hypothetical protein
MKRNREPGIIVAGDAKGGRASTELAKRNLNDASPEERREFES